MHPHTSSSLAGPFRDAPRFTLRQGFPESAGPASPVTQPVYPKTGRGECDASQKGGDEKTVRPLISLGACRFSSSFPVCQWLEGWPLIQGGGARHTGDIAFSPDSIEIYYHINRMEIHIEMGGVACCLPCSASLQRDSLWFLAGESGY
jgi:hypothetical protein